MFDIIIDTLLDSLKMLPFLFLTFLFIEYFEHRMSKKTVKVISSSGKHGPFIGGLLGAFPQCGFSISATNLYSTRIITLGTLIAVYLSTSDEMLPVLISNKMNIATILTIIVTKMAVGIIAGFIVDKIFRKKKDKDKLEDFCQHEHCGCEKGILKSSIIHTINIYIFILITSLGIALLLYFAGDNFIKNLFFQGSLFGPVISAFVGLIPNCATSVALTELFVENIISIGSLLSGLLTCSGVGLMILFKTNKDLKENLKIVGILLTIGILVGIIVDIII